MSIHDTLQDPALRQYYEALFAMYGSPGWKKLMEDVDYLIEQNDRVSGVDTAEQLWFRKGELNQMLWLQNNQAMVEAAYKELLDKQDGEEPTTGGVAKVVEPGRE